MFIRKFSTINPAYKPKWHNPSQLGTGTRNKNTSKSENQNSNVSATSLYIIPPGNNLNFSELYKKTYAKVFKKIICSNISCRDTITASHNFSAGSIKLYICNTRIQRDICRYSFKFFSRPNSETQKEIISYKKYSIQESSFLHNTVIDISFFYHTYFLYSTTVLVIFDPTFRTNLSRYVCINPRTPSDH